MASCGGEKKNTKKIIPLEALLTSKKEKQFKVEFFLWLTTYNYYIGIIQMLKYL